jgi:hypothetical protein
MSEDPKTLEEAQRLRQQHEEEGHIKITRELTELIMERWPDSEEAREARSALQAASAERRKRSERGDLNRRRTFSTGAAEKAIATKRKDQGYGMCRRRGCSRPAAEPGGECTEHAAGTKMVETKRRKNMID